MLTRINSATILGLNAYMVQVEVDTSTGISRHIIVGLPDTAVRESKERIEAAIKNSDINFPFFKKFTINLAPADLKKEGPSFDLPIAIAMLANEGYFPLEQLAKMLIIGELSLNGDIRSIRGVLAMVIEAKAAGFKEVLIPFENAEEAALVKDMKVIPLRNLTETIEYLSGKTEIEPFQGTITYQEQQFVGDFSEVKGQYCAKRALEIAAAGGHNAIMVGSPGCGKTMLTKRFNTILPDLSYEESVEVSKVYSVAGLLKKGLIRHRQFRAPHHTISDVGIVGGGRIPKPGEISLAHLGVLFMDEFPEFDRRVLEVMRQPLEDGEVTITRAMMSLTYPAQFLLIAAMNPCPCGYAMDNKKQCVCSDHQIRSYWKRLSGPILERIDLFVEVPTLLPEELANKPTGESSQDIRQRIIMARERQNVRFKERQGIYTNARMYPKDLREFGNVTTEANKLLVKAIDTMDLSARSYDRILKVARTIADLANNDEVLAEHVAEALQYKVNGNYYGHKN